MAASQSNGSLATRVYNRLDSPSTAISGELIFIVDEEIAYVENYTGVSIDNTDIPEKYQGAITDLATANAIDAMSLEGADVSSVQLGDFTVKKGTDSNLTSASAYYKDKGERKLKVLGRRIEYKKVIS